MRWSNFVCIFQDNFEPNKIERKGIRQLNIPFKIKSKRFTVCWNECHTVRRAYSKMDGVAFCMMAGDGEGIRFSLLGSAWISVGSRIQHLALILCVTCFVWPFSKSKSLSLNGIAFEMILENDVTSKMRVWDWHKEWERDWTSQ